MTRAVYLTGGTGYVGASLLSKLLGRGHKVKALARAGSERKLPAACEPVTGDALSAPTFVATVPPRCTFVHMVGTPHPAPWKGRQFREVDLVALRASVMAARAAGVEHFVYVSVAHPAPLMKSYIEVRRECETEIERAGLIATIVRPWYVLGPGHWWPVALKPFYSLLEAIPSTREGARRLGLVTLDQMTETMLRAIENPPDSTRVLTVPEIRRMPTC
ncbi:MAG: NAD(P)H-binding protein [Bryobacteraceae bacterium]